MAPEKKLYAMHEDEEVDAFLTPWSIPHFLVGAAAKERGLSFWAFELLHGLYETKDYMQNKADLTKNSLFNSLGDQAIGTVGHLIVSQNPNSYKWTLLYTLSWLTAVSLGDRIG